AFDSNGALAYPDFVETVTKLVPMYWIRAGGGGLFVLGMVMCAWNLIMTWRGRPAVLVETLQQAPPLSRAYAGDPVYHSDLENVIGLAKVTDEVTELSWHRAWERFPVKFGVFVIGAILVGTLIEAVPMFAIRSNVPSIESVRPYSPLELIGRDIYRAEGCYNCHSQMVRPIWAETKRYGEYSKPGEFVYDHPFQWGSRRIGPDLHRVGGKYSHDWHVRHFENPRQLVQGSIMPTYGHLLNQTIDWNEVPRTLHAMVLLGVPYDQSTQDHAIEIAKGQARAMATQLEGQGGYRDMQDKKVMALVAYLQRLGVDIGKSPAETASAPRGGEAP
ncbi:MAG: cytochrome-c oxidase, cbb3-type subunit II, partial [Phycisphaerae bacterium]|nr:cytochrome-c oxidase, cbb3-type subunit II [Phycisphaerae bacterium]